MQFKIRPNFKKAIPLPNVFFFNWNRMSGLLTALPPLNIYSIPQLPLCLQKVYRSINIYNALTKLLSHSKYLCGCNLCTSRPKRKYQFYTLNNPFACKYLSKRIN